MTAPQRGVGHAHPTANGSRRAPNPKRMTPVQQQYPPDKLPTHRSPGQTEAESTRPWSANQINHWATKVQNAPRTTTPVQPGNRNIGSEQSSHRDSSSNSSTVDSNRATTTAHAEPRTSAQAGAAAKQQPRHHQTRNDSRSRQRQVKHDERPIAPTSCAAAASRIHRPAAATRRARTHQTTCC